MWYKISVSIFKFNLKKKNTLYFTDSEMNIKWMEKKERKRDGLYGSCFFFFFSQQDIGNHSKNHHPRLHKYKYTPAHMNSWLMFPKKDINKDMDYIRILFFLLLL